MNATTALTIATIIAVAVMAGHAFVKATASQYKDDPAASAYHGEVLRDNVSEKAQDVADHQRLMMDRMKDSQDRMKDAMERNKH